MSSIVRRSASRICAAFSTAHGVASDYSASGRIRARIDVCTLAVDDGCDGQCQRPHRPTRRTRSSRSSITGSCTAKASTRRCAPTTASRSSSIGTCGGCGVGGDARAAGAADRRADCSAAFARPCARPAWARKPAARRTSGMLRDARRRRAVPTIRRRLPDADRRHHRQAARRSAARGVYERRRQGGAGVDRPQPPGRSTR